MRRRPLRTTPNLHVTRVTRPALARGTQAQASELVELAGTAAIDGHKKRITPRYINLAIRADEEFNTLLQGAVISGGGVQPHINKVLVKKQKKSGKRRSSSGKSKKSEKSKGEKKSKSKKAKKEKKGKKSAKAEATQSA